MPSTFKQISAVIVTFNSGQIVGEAIKSIPEGTEIIVVDNASTDDSIDVARRHGARCIQNDQNLGFGIGCNIGVAASDREFILFLNPDATLKHDALAKLLDTLSAHRDAAAAGPKLLTHSGQVVWRDHSILHPLKEKKKYSEEPEGTCCIPLLTGAAILCRRDAFERIGGFDKNIFMYYEDDDISRRFVEAGCYLIYVPEAEVLHDFGLSSGNSFALTCMKSEKKTESQIYVMKKYGYPVHAGKMRLKAIQRLTFAIAKFDTNRIAASLGVLRGLRNLRHGN